MSPWSRREFMKASGAGMASAGSFVLSSTKGAAAPSERVRHAVIGVGGMGSTHARTVLTLRPDCELVAVCDVDRERRARAVAYASDRTKIAAYEDYRLILDDP